ncbi:MAG TPA: DUF87 domain-containing protein [Bacillus sp. (in: firmicutes)]|nr:DUF87 domain-containing protein [Bacillus sp. (in: firmicutes)]
MITFNSKKKKKGVGQGITKKKGRAFQQVSSSKTKREGLDFVSPSMVKELRPIDMTIQGTANDYIVEIGGTSETARYFRSFFAEITGGTTWANMLNPLILGEFGKGDTDLAIHIEPVETSQELEDIAKRIRAIESDLMMERNGEKISRLQEELYDLKERQRRLRTKMERPFRASIQAVVSSTDLNDLRKYSRNLIRQFAGQEIIMRSPDGKQLDALMNITPLSDNFMYKEHTFSYESSNLADFFPFGNGGISHRTGIVWGYDELGRPVYYDGWHSKLMNHNMVITGVSGGGKTFSVMALTHRSAHIGIRTAIICPKGDYRHFVTSMGCPYIDLAPDSPFKINFFDVDVEEDDKGNSFVNIESAVQAARAIVFKMLRIMEEQALTGKVKVKIENYIRELYRERGITEQPNSLLDAQKPVQRQDGTISISMNGRLKDMPTLGDLYMKLAQDEEIEIREISNLLRNFTRYGDSKTQSIFDCQSTVKIQDVPIFAFGLDRLDEEIMRPIGLFVATKWQSTKFAKKNRHQRKRVIVDEAQIPMQDYETAVWLENEFRVVRFFNTSMCAVTQGFEVFTRVPQGMGILKNAPTKLFLKQDTIDIEEIQGKFDLSEGEAQFLVHTARKGLGIIHIDNEASIIKIDSNQQEYELFTTDPNDIAGMRRS